MGDQWQRLIDEIAKERDHQDEKYGGTAHDDLHTFNDWIVLATRYATKAAAYPACNDDWTEEDSVRFRKNMIRVAAIAIAAVEFIDRHDAVDAVFGETAAVEAASDRRT